MNLDERIKQILSRIENLEDRVDEDPPVTFVYHSEVWPPVFWEREVLESTLDIKLPADLVAFWQLASKVHLFEEKNYFQWGMIIKSPNEIVDFNKYRIAQTPEDFRSGDLVIGEFRGDLDLVVMRANPQAEDFGSILIALPMEARRDWPLVATSFAEFLERYIESPDTKYWSS